MSIGRLAFLGTGLMGGPMARNLARAGHDVHAWNRTPAKAEALAGDGVHPEPGAAEAVAGADVVITMLSDGPAVDAMAADPGVRGALKRGAVWIDMSSTRPSEARARAADLAALGVAHLDAPVSGGTRGAEAGTLAIMVGGPAETFAAMAPVFAPMGRATRVGPDGTGQLAKLANQAIVATTIGAVAEAMLLLERGGADPAAVRAALKGGFADSTILQQHGERMTTGNFAPGGPSRLQLKDLRNALDEAGGLGLSLPMTEEMGARFARLVDEMEGADLDHSALYLELLARQGGAA